jgi:23S rRNA (uracil1939-C5)-methyltransferase
MDNQNKDNIINKISECPHYKKCGGCQMQNLSYLDGLRWKEGTVIKLLSKFCHVEPIIGMENPFHYRNKVQAAFSEAKNHKIISGIYQSSTHNIVPVDLCMIEDKKADEIIVSIRKLLPFFKIRPYNEYTDTGLLRHVLIKRGFSTGEIMVVLVTSGPIFPSKNNFVKALLKIHPEITTIIQNINPQDTSLVLGENEKVLYGPGKIRDKLSGLTFLISPKSFYQINPVQTEILYNKAIDFADLKGSETVIDAYCGIGTIALAASSHQAWSANIFTTVSDAFPKKAVSSVTGIGGMAGGLGGLGISYIAGAVLNYYKNQGHIETGYVVMFVVAGSMYIIAWTIMNVFAPKNKKVVLD